MGRADDNLSAKRQKLIEYISQSQEKANEDKIINYFRFLYPEFTRQQDAEKSDGYVPGHFVLELKGKKSDWLSGFFQGLSYKKDLDFSLVVVASKEFLTIWDAKKLQDSLISEVLKLRESKAPNKVGKELAKKYKDKQISFLKKAIFNFEKENLFLDQKIEKFEKVLKEAKPVRLKITTGNFDNILNQMKVFFDPQQPRKTVRAFYNMLFSWNENSVLQISSKNSDQSTLGGEVIEGLIPGKRLEFKNFVENYYIYLSENENKDDFFAKYDVALDVIDKDFRKKHGIFFTDLDLSKFAMWFVRKNLGDIGKNYLVIDPACGSGNLITNWRSPLELRHKVVSEIEPELLYAVEKRMKGDAWHNGKFTVVPKVSENKGLNFLDKNAKQYLGKLTTYLSAKGQSPDKPIAFLCNPPYKGSDEQSTSGVQYSIDRTILDITGNHGSSERYCSFLAQMRLICKAAKDNGLPGNSILLLFTKTAWLTQRKSFKKIRNEMLGVFEDIDGFIVNGKEFFDVKGKFPIAFTIWKYKGENANLESDRGINLLDLTFLKKSDLSSINWKSSVKMSESCKSLENKGLRFKIGIKTEDMAAWLSQKRIDVIRNRKADEHNKMLVGGLPKGDERRNNQSTYGELKGGRIGFMGDLTPVRINQENHFNNPWFRLNKQFMDVNKNRCASGPIDKMNYAAFDLESAKKSFLWFSLGRTFATKEYPMSVDNENLWPINEEEINDEILKVCFSIGFSENDCIECTFPANNPVERAPEIKINNPMTPLNEESFWCKYMVSFFNETPEDIYDELVQAVNHLFQEWEKELGDSPEIHVGYEKPYFLEDNKILTRQAGIRQIKDYANLYEKSELKSKYQNVQKKLNIVKEKFYNMLMDKNELDYFGKAREQASLLSQETKLSKIKKIEKRETKKQKSSKKA